MGVICATFYVRLRRRWDPSSKLRARRGTRARESWRHSPLSPTKARLFANRPPKKETATRELSRKKRPESGRRALVPPLSPGGFRGWSRGEPFEKSAKIKRCNNSFSAGLDRAHNTNYGNSSAQSREPKPRWGRLTRGEIKYACA